MTRRLYERSHEIQSAGTTFRRNRQHLVKTAKPSVQQWTSECTEVDAILRSDQPSYLQPQALLCRPVQRGTTLKHHSILERKVLFPLSLPKTHPFRRIIREPAKLSHYVRI